jgi:hypothetical protein
MTDEQRLVYTRGILLNAEITMNAMIADNKQREVMGESIAYGEKAFIDLIEEYGIHHNALIESISGINE